MPFYILQNKDTNEHYRGICACGVCNTMSEVPNQFPNTENALAYAQSNNLDRYYPKILVDDTWKVREKQRFTSGEYVQPVWSTQQWYRNKPDVLGLYPHVSVKNADKIAFTETPEKGMLDTQTRMAPGKFLNRFYNDVLAKSDIELWANEHRTMWANDLKLQWAETPDQIEAVYSMTASFQSCMQKDPSHWAAKVTPTRAYGAGDLAVAYIVQSGKLIARALVWKEKKLVGRVYGDAARLNNALREEGIDSKSTNNEYKTFQGAKLLKIPYENGYIGPYIDGSRRISETANPDFLIIDSSGDIDATEVRGVIGNKPKCACCTTRSGLTGVGDPVTGVTFHYCQDHIAANTWFDSIYGNHYPNTCIEYRVVYYKLDDYSDRLIACYTHKNSISNNRIYKVNKPDGEDRYFDKSNTRKVRSKGKLEVWTSDYAIANAEVDAITAELTDKNDMWKYNNSHWASKEWVTAHCTKAENGEWTKNRVNNDLCYNSWNPNPLYMKTATSSITALRITN